MPYRPDPNPMKKILFSLSMLVFLVQEAGAQSVPAYRTSGNFRHTLNPGSFCPYCVGSPFMMMAHRFQRDDDGNLQNVFTTAYGHDNYDGRIAFDALFGYYRSKESYVSTASIRVARRIPIGAKCYLGFGSRITVDFLQRKNISDGSVVRGSKANADAGLMFFDTKGQYIGISLNQVTAPWKTETDTVFGAQSRMLTAQAGYVILVGSKMSLLPEVSFRYDGQKKLAEAGGYFRFERYWCVGASYMAGGASNPLALKAGYMSSEFKLQLSAEPSADGWNFEAGIIYRIKRGDCDSKCKPDIYNEVRPDDRF